MGSLSGGSLSGGSLSWGVCDRDPPYGKEWAISILLNEMHSCLNFIFIGFPLFRQNSRIFHVFKSKSPGILKIFLK